MRRRIAILAVVGFCMPVYGWAANPNAPAPTLAPPTLVPPGLVTPLPGRPLGQPLGQLPNQSALPYNGPPPYLQSERSDTLRADELQVLNLEQKLGSDSPEVQQLKQNLRDAQRDLQQYRMSPSHSDAKIRRQRLDDSLRELDLARLRAEQEASARQAQSGQQQK